MLYLVLLTFIWPSPNSVVSFLPAPSSAPGAQWWGEGVNWKATLGARTLPHQGRTFRAEFNPKQLPNGGLLWSHRGRGSDLVRLKPRVALNQKRQFLTSDCYIQIIFSAMLLTKSVRVQLEWDRWGLGPVATTSQTHLACPVSMCFMCAFSPSPQFWGQCWDYLPYSVEEISSEKLIDLRIWPQIIRLPDIKLRFRSQLQV